MAIGKYDVLAELGRGAGSVVFRVRRESDHRIYALKIVKVGQPDDRKYVEQLQHEFAVAQRLKHENLIRVDMLDVQRGLLGGVKGARLLLEFFDGVPLTPASTLPMYKLLTIAARAARGVAAMHAAGVCHADLKPENILVNARGEVKVIDFGVAWLRGEDKDRVQGTLDYLAPEQAKRKRVNEKTDIFNLGATLYRVLCGGTMPPAFRQAGTGTIQEVDKLVRPMPELRMETPADVDELVRRCVRYRPEERPDSMAEVAAALRRLAKKYVAARQQHVAEGADSEEDMDA
jgi:eukaryotic-like serine/threonine-protein kinase